ncbi:MAG: Glycosyl transferases group 1 [Syntrophorhabdus sp. PtaU1.Bin153]|nr:MAG: Glycosyl transferases group 1 [Syntrophorhabdus sp. PtaU1.Bin153]
MRKVLIIAEYFPPAGAVGTFRVTKFVKYLREFGWEPVILTLREECYIETKWPLDQSLMKDIPEGISVYRTSLWKSALFKDPGIRWIPPLFAGISSVIRKERPTLLYITGNPFWPMIVAPTVKFFHRLNYVVDLRDPWKLAQPIKPLRGYKARSVSLINRILEPIVIKHASKTICVSEQMCQEYRHEYSDLSPNHFAVITNGYDPDDFSSVRPKKFNEFTIVYAGKFLTGESFRDPTQFFCALRKLLDRNFNVHFVHVGQRDAEVMRAAARAGIKTQCDFVGQLPYKETISYTKGADLLLLIGGGQRTEQTGKIFDYMGCERPILALASKDSGIGDVARDASNITILENNDDFGAITGAIEAYYTGGQNGSTKSGGSTKYHRRVLTSKLAKVLDQAG